MHIRVYTSTYQCTHSLTAMITAGNGSEMRLLGAERALYSEISGSAKPSRTYGRTSMSFCTSEASTMGDCFWPFLLGVVRVSKRETMDWCVKPMSVVCLEYRLLLRLCRRAVSFCIMLFRGTPRSTSSLWFFFTPGGRKIALFGRR